MQLRCVLFRNVVILVGQCGLDKTIYSNLVRTKLLNKSKHIIVCDSQNPWTRPERQIKVNQLDVSLRRTFLYGNCQQIVSIQAYIQCLNLPSWCHIYGRLFCLSQKDIDFISLNCYSVSQGSFIRHCPKCIS